MGVILSICGVKKKTWCQTKKHFNVDAKFAVSKQASFQEPSSLWYRFILNICTLQGTNISHLGKRKIIDSKVLAGEGICSFPGGYMYSKQVYYIRIKICICIV